MLKAILYLCALLIVCQSCNIEKMQRIEKLMERFQDLVKSKQYKWESAMQSAELLNMISVREIDSMIYDEARATNIQDDFSNRLTMAKQKECEGADKVAGSILVCESKHHFSEMILKFNGRQNIPLNAACC